MTVISAPPAVVEMSSRELAGLTGKRHPDMKRDILSMLKALGGDVSSFARTARQHGP